MLPDILVRFEDWFRPSCKSLLIVPPFASLEWPSIGVHLLQAEARKHGHAVQILYANVLFAMLIGVGNYRKIAASPRHSHLGERLFCKTAYDLPSLGATNTEVMRDIDQFVADAGIDIDAIRLERLASEFTKSLAAFIVRGEFQLVGCTSTFEQTLASLALLKAIKDIAPSICTLLGGANCEGDMAQGLAAAAPMVDHLFSGEADLVFPEFIRAFESKIQQPRIIRADRPFDLTNAQCPEYSEYFSALKFAGLNSDSSWISYESSRGCWWGEKHHCTFCGLNGQQIAQRAKHSDRVFADLKVLLAAHPARRICMVDNIMPADYHRSLVPRLRELGDDVTIFYEQKANLTLKQVRNLVHGGVTVIQPGIESLSTSLLKQMRKGVSAAQNIALLRYALACGLSVNWNLLHSMPGDQAEDYRGILSLLPALAHLQPPSTLSALSIDRFSPYFNEPGRFEIKNLRPAGRISDLYPPGTNIDAIAYHFEGEYVSGISADDSLKLELFQAVASWQDCWHAENKPILSVAQVDNDLFLVVDTRPGFGPRVRFIESELAAVVLGGVNDIRSEKAQWALAQGLATIIDDHFVPIAVATQETLEFFETSAVTA